MKIFPSSKYVLIPITDEQTYLKYCDWVEELENCIKNYEFPPTYL